MDTVQVSFRFIGDAISPHHITEVLGIQPSASGIKGEPSKLKSQTPNPNNFWRVDSIVSSSEPLTNHLHQLLNFLEPHRKQIEVLKLEGYRPEFFCGLFYTRESGYISLDFKTLQRVVNLGASIEINTYEDSMTND